MKRTDSGVVAVSATSDLCQTVCVWVEGGGGWWPCVRPRGGGGKGESQQWRWHRAWLAAALWSESFAGDLEECGRAEGATPPGGLGQAVVTRDQG